MILIDMDGVLANIHNKWLDMINNHHGTSYRYKDITSWDIHLCLNLPESVYKFIDVPGFFEEAKPIEDSQKVLESLWQRYPCRIVSAASYSNNAVIEKVRWLKKYYPFIKNKEIIFTKDKSVIAGHYLIDDGHINLRDFPGVSVVFDQPWNQDFIIDPPKSFRVRGWKEINKHFLGD